MSPAKLHLVRHAQGYHNLTPDNHGILDPALTPFGKQQCADLQQRFPYQSRLTHIVASPIKRTLWTALLAFAPALAANPNLKVIALPEIQETSDLPCDTGSPRAELEREFAGQPVDLSRVEDGWDSKKGRWAPTPQAVNERARVGRVWLRELAGEDGEVVVVTHGGLLHMFTQDWSDFEKNCGTGWDNVEFRSYTFVPGSGDKASVVETQESRDGRGAVPCSEEENLRLRRKAETEWMVESAPSQKNNTATGPAIQEVGLEAVKAQA